jgi:hypothetical protein
LFEELAVTHVVAQGSRGARLTLVLTDSGL